MRAPVLCLALCAFACKKEGASVPHATDAECEAYRNKMFSFLPAVERDSAAKLGLDKPTPLEMKLCKERMVGDEIACALKAATQEEALACKSAHDIRPADAKRTPEECAAYSAHVKRLAAENEAGQAVGPPFTPAMAAMFERECQRWLSKKRFDCVMKAPSAMGLTMCPP